MGRSFESSDLLGQGGPFGSPGRGFSIQSREVLRLSFAQFIEPLPTDAGQLPSQSISLRGNRELALVAGDELLLQS